MRIKEYDVVFETDFNDELRFVDLIKSRMQAGWQPIGGISTNIGINPETKKEYYLFAQAVVKYLPD